MTLVPGEISLFNCIMGISDVRKVSFKVQCKHSLEGFTSFLLRVNCTNVTCILMASWFLYSTMNYFLLYLFARKTPSLDCFCYCCFVFNCCGFLVVFFTLYVWFNSDSASRVVFL